MLFQRRQSQPMPATHGYERAVLNEISMLVDYVAGCPAMTLDKLKLAGSMGGTSHDVPAPAVLAKIAAIKDTLSANGDNAISEREWSFLLLTRDALNAMIKPASGLTVAYTAMVVGNRRGKAVHSRAVMAAEAYAGLRRTAFAHRWGQRLLVAFTVLATLVAVWDSAKVALGKSVLQNLQDLRVKQAEIWREKVRLEEAFALPSAPVHRSLQAADGRPESAGTLRLTIRLCDRPRLLFPGAFPNAPPSADFRDDEVFESASHQDVCDRDKLLAKSFFLAHAAVDAYAADWPALAGAGFDVLAQGMRVIGAATRRLCQQLSPDCADRGNPLSAVLAKEQKEHADSELLVAPVLLVLGNYILPVVFAVLGAAAFVILDFYGKLRDSLLAPRDHVLSWIRLVLGSVIGACIGLFFSAYGPQAPSAQPDVIGALTLTASGVGFLAGFGVEGVFAMLGTLIKRVFGSEPA